MNARKAKKLREKALEFSRTDFGRTHLVTPRKAYQSLKGLYNSTPQKLKANSFE